MGSGWDMIEKHMGKGTAGYVACMGKDITQLMSMNALEQQSQVQEEFEYVYKSSQGY